ncbi:hypothetical protein QYF61_027218 [Mycteria americana]|uniref:Uncharacterized protein n=1 Tax=Mycteria americana TaxID=33587 RepID=A0AAN7S4U1_MYCAM|nr:hypothetical protein QYF61_027218 [Mycteria americana]
MRVVRHWNRLPGKTVDAPSLEVFKTSMFLPYGHRVGCSWRRLRISLAALCRGTLQQAGLTRGLPLLEQRLSTLAWTRRAKTAAKRQQKHPQKKTLDTRNSPGFGPRDRGKGWSKEDVPLVEQDQVRKYFSKLDIHKSMGPDGMHLRVLRELADVIGRPLNNLGLIMATQRMSKDWRKANVTPIFKKVKKEDPGNHGLVSITLIPGKMMEQLIRETIARHMKDKKIISMASPGGRQMIHKIIPAKSHHNDATMYLKGKKPETPDIPPLLLPISGEVWQRQGTRSSGGYHRLVKSARMRSFHQPNCIGSTSINTNSGTWTAIATVVFFVKRTSEQG